MEGAKRMKRIRQMPSLPIRQTAAERDVAIPPAYSGPRPSGGVGGTRHGVKCLHSHYAWYLAGGDDPVGRWVEAQLQAQTGAPTALRS